MALVAERREQKALGKLESVDVLSNLVLQEEESLSDQELLSTVVTLFVAGHETTTHLLGNGLFALLQRPELIEEIRDGDAAIPLFVEEMARFDGSVPRSWRLAKSDLELGGVKIKKATWSYQFSPPPIETQKYLLTQIISIFIGTVSATLLMAKAFTSVLAHH